jgi:hypothetical protein
MNYIARINAAQDQMELGNIVEEFLASIGEAEKSTSETYEETAARFSNERDDNASEIMSGAANKWHSVDNTEPR